TVKPSPDRPQETQETQGLRTVRTVWTVVPPTNRGTTPTRNPPKHAETPARSAPEPNAHPAHIPPSRNGTARPTDEGGARARQPRRSSGTAGSIIWPHESSP